MKSQFITMNTSRYYVSREDGTVTGPHHPAVIRKEIDAGTLTLDTPLCLDGTEDWMPAIEWGAEIVPPPPAPKAHAYTAALEPVGQKSALKSFWALVGIIIGLILCVSGVFAQNLAITAVLIIIGLLWGGAGMAELIRQSRKR